MGLTPFHIAVQVRDIEEARRFYKGLLGCGHAHLGCLCYLNRLNSKQQAGLKILAEEFGRRIS